MPSTTGPRKVQAIKEREERHQPAFIHLFIPQIFIKCFLCAWQNFTSWDAAVGDTDRAFVLSELTYYRRDEQKTSKQRDKPTAKKNSPE